MSRSSMLQSALVSFAGTGLSRLLGLVRDIVLAARLGAGTVSDALWMALTIPGSMRRFVADEGLTGALVPAIAHSEVASGPQGANRLAARLLTALLVIGGALALVGVVLAPWLVTLFAPGFVGEQRELTITMTRIVLPLVVFLSLVSWAEGLLNHRNHFFVPKLAPGIVSAAVVVAAYWPGITDLAQLGIVVCWGFIVGGFLHLLVCIPPLYVRYGLVWPRLDVLTDPYALGVFREMGKVAVIGAMAQINLIVLRSLTSFLEVGSMTWYTNATRIVDVSQGVIAVGVGSAMLPVVSRAVAEQDWVAFREAFATATRLVAALVVPAAAFLVVLSRPTVAVLFRRGAYTWSDVTITAHSLVWLVPYMLGLAGIQIVKKPFFALERRNELIGVGGLGVLATAVFGGVLAPRYGVPGLALALSLSTVGQFIAYLWLLRRIVSEPLGLAALVAPLGRMVLAAVPAALAGLALGQLGQWSLGATPTNVALLALAGLVGGLVYGATASYLGIREVVAIWRRLLRR